MTPEEKHNYLRRFQKFQQGREKFFAPLFNEVLHKQYLTFTSHVKHIGQLPALDKIDSGAMAILLKDIYVDAATVYGDKIRIDLKREKGRMPIGFSERIRELITEYYKTDILNMAEDITNTTKDLIREVFTNAYEQGLGIDDIIVQLEGTDLSKIRARTIARTETVTAANKGAIIVAKETGLLMNKEWLATIDKRTRHDHSRANGQIVPIDDYFNVGGFNMAQPGDIGGKDGQPKTPAKERINCRCTVLPIPVRRNGKLVMA